MQLKALAYTLVCGAGIGAALYVSLVIGVSR